jgi:hypothetical protein
MECVALTLDSSSNSSLIDIGAFISNYNKTCLMIEKFHLTLMCSQSHDDCLELFNYFKESKDILKNLKPKRWIVMNGGNTDWQYLAIEIDLPKKFLEKINSLRKRLLNDKYFELLPHISVAQGEKGVFSANLLQELNKTFPKIPYLKIKNIVRFNSQHQIVRKISLSQDF